jgi:hypothetical protein
MIGDHTFIDASGLRDDESQVGGFFCAEMETTSEMLAKSERRRETARLHSLLFYCHIAALGIN